MSRSNHKRDCEVQEGACPSIVPAGAPDWITPELVEATIRVWQPYYKDVLTPEEAVILHAAKNEAGSNCWKLWVMSDWSFSRCLVEMFSRLPSMAAQKSANVL